MTTMVKVRPWVGPIKEMDIEELDVLYTKPIDDGVQWAIEEFLQAIKSTVKTGIEFYKIKRELDERLSWRWNVEDEDDEHPASDGTWEAWKRHSRKAVRARALRAAEQAERASRVAALPAHEGA